VPRGPAQCEVLLPHKQLC